nr:hypothetical protein [Halanaerobacter jeridensis]
MSTTAEAVLDDGAIMVLGASPDGINVPVKVNPKKIGYQAGKVALKNNTKVIIITEPRFSKPEQRLEKIKVVRRGIVKSGAQIEDVFPNVGAQITRFANFTGKVIIIVSNSGGVAFDAAYNQEALKVITGTVVRTVSQKGIKPVKTAAQRAIAVATEYGAGITIVAASSNSYEDILAVDKIATAIIDLGFLDIKQGGIEDHD